MPKVQYYLMGKNEWRSAGAWPIPETQYLAYYLRNSPLAGPSEPDQVLMPGANSRFGRGRLHLVVPPRDEPPDRFVYDPATPVPSRGGPICCTGSSDEPAGAYDQSEIEMRQDVLVYTSEPLTQALEVTGNLRAVLYVSSSAKDTDFTVKLVDVSPDGKAYNLQEGVLRARYREGYGKTVWMEPDRVYEVSVDLHATSNLFRQGHRIRLEVSSSNFPRLDRNLNTGGRNYDETKWVVAKNAVHHSPRYPSRIILPIVPAQK
jgi:putative CocE/NonD family hydrolase